MELELARPASKEPPPPAPTVPRRRRSKNGEGGRPTAWRIKPDAYEKVREISDATRIPQAVVVEIIIENYHRRWKEAPENAGDQLDGLRRLIYIPVNSRPPADGPPEEGST